MDENIKYTRQELLTQMQAQIDKYASGLADHETIKAKSVDANSAIVFVNCLNAINIYKLLITEVKIWRELLESMKEESNG